MHTVWYKRIFEYFSRLFHIHYVAVSFISGNICLCTDHTLVLCSSHGCFCSDYIQLWESFLFLRSFSLFFSFIIVFMLTSCSVYQSVTLNCFLFVWNNKNNEEKRRAKQLKRYERIALEMSIVKTNQKWSYGSSNEY